MARIWMNPATDSAELRALVKAHNPGAQIMGKAPRPRKAETFRSEPTAVGDQLLIPGCEKLAPPGAKTSSLTFGQLDLWSVPGKSRPE